MKKNIFLLVFLSCATLFPQTLSAQTAPVEGFSLTGL
jgi:hypothetical protein